MDWAKLADLVALLVGEVVVGEAFEAGDEGFLEAGDAVAVGEDSFAFDFVELEADLGGGVFVVVEAGDEGGDGSFEIDIVFPEGVVGIDEEGFGRGEVSFGLLIQGIKGGGEMREQERSEVFPLRFRLRCGLDGMTIGAVLRKGKRVGSA